MKVHLTSSEAIAKALKGSGLSLDEKIGVATEAWNSSSIFFPHKDEFLLEWVCGSLLKVTSKSAEKLGETACLHQGYWTLLSYLLGDILRKPKALSKSTTSPALRLPVILAFTSLVQYLSTLPSLEDDYKHIMEFLETARLCLHYFMTDLSTVYRPSLDQLANLTVNILHAIILHSDRSLKSGDANFMDMDKESEAHQTVLISLVKFANEVLPSFDAMLVTTPNQKKILQIVIGKLLFPLLKVKQIFSRHFQENSNDYETLSFNIIEILRHGLFHPESIPEYMVLLQQLSESTSDKKVNNSSKQFFDQIREYAHNEDTEPDAIFSMLPTLFNLFVTEFRNRRKQPGAGLGTKSSKNSLDITRMVEFEFFLELLKIIKERHPSKNSPWWQSMTLFKALYGLLQQFLELNVYLPSNDAISKRQFTILSDVTKDMVDALQVLKDEGTLEGLMFSSLNVMLQIDHLLLEQYIEVLWKPMIMPLGEAESSANVFAMTLMQIYSKLRQFDVYMDGLLLALRKIDILEMDILLRKPMFSRDFLNKFSACITMDLPSSQSLSIFARFVDELSVSFLSKKRKRASSTRSASPVPNSPPQLIALYLSKFILSLQKSNFGRFTISHLFNNFVGPIIEEFISGNRKGDPEFEMIFVAPALEIHYAMVQSVPKYAEDFGKIEWINELMNSEIRNARVCLGLCNVILQQVNTEAEKEKPDLDLQRKLVGHVLKMFENCVYTNATWNGLLMELNWSNFHVAIWKIISEDWLDTICLLATQEQLQMIARVIIDSFLSLENMDICVSIDQLSINSLSIRLFRSAHFYELTPMRDCFVQVFLSHLFNFLKSLVDKYHHQTRKSATMPIDIITTISKPIHLRTFLAEIDDLFSSSALETKYPREHAIACTTIAMYMSIVHLFPIEYFDKQERDCLLVTAFLVDRWISGLDVEGAKENAARLKCSLICRDAQLKIMKYLNNAGVLSYNPSFFNWLILSTFKYVNEGPEETTQLISSILITTEAMERLALRKIFSQIVAKTEDFILDPQSYLHNILKTLRDHAFPSDPIQRFMKWLENNDEAQPVNSTALRLFNVYVDSALAQVVSTMKPTIRVRKEEMDTDLPRPRRPEVLTFIEFYASLETIVTSVVDAFRSFLERNLDQIHVLSSDTKRVELVNVMIAKMMSMKPYLHIYGSILRCRRIMDNRDNLLVALTPIAHLSSPTIRFLQLLLQLTSFSSISDSLQKALEVMSDYVAILCDVMGDHANPLDPLPVVAVVWYIYGLTHVSGQELVASQLLDAFGLCLKTMRNEHFDIIVHSLLNHTPKDPLSDGMLEKGKKRFDDTAIFVQFARTLFVKSRTGQKRRLLRSISSFIAKFGIILATIQSVDLVWNILDLLALLCSDKAIDLRIYDISQILSCISLLTSPAAAHRFQSLSDVKANMLFDVIYRILSGVLRFHRTQLVETIPPFTALIEILFHCFKSVHPSLALKHIKTSQRQDPFPLLTLASPLNEQSARNFSRLLSTIVQKPSDTLNLKVMSDTLSFTKAFGKHAPYLLAEYLKIQTSSISSISIPVLKAALLPGLYSLLDLCGEYEREMVMTGLDVTGKTIFKALYQDYLRDHKYTGR